MKWPEPSDPNYPSKARLHLPPAVIAGAYQTGVLGVRGLLRRGVAAICCDSNASQPGFRSVYGPARLCPDPDVALEHWCAFMIELAQEFRNSPVLIASSDKFITAIARCRTELMSRYRLSAGAAIQGMLADKLTQYRLAKTHGLPMPVTRFVSSRMELRDVAGQIDYPCLLKPHHFREWQKFSREHPFWDRKIVIVESPQALIENYCLAESVTPELIVQEVIRGGDTAKRVYTSCHDSAGRKIGSAMFRELRCDPIQFGPATVSEPVVDREVEVICDRFLAAVGYSGICEFEMKWDSRDMKVKLIEANPRLSGGGDAAPYAGVDLCWLHYLDLIGERVEPVRPSGRAFKHIVLRADARAVPAYLRAGLVSWREVINSYRSPRAYFDIDWKDWRYTLETLGVAVSRLIRGFVGGRVRGGLGL